MKGPKTIFVCSNCGSQSPKWLGRCPDCQAWNTYEEELINIENKTQKNSVISSTPSINFNELELPEYIRFSTGMIELDRVLGGGIVQGEVVLLSGEPGIGKSTLLLQICQALGQDKKVLYVSGEESKGQLKLRYDRLEINTKYVWLYNETSCDAVINEFQSIKPDVVIIDSIQTIYTDKSTTSPGSLTQVRESAMAFIQYAKETGTSVFLIGHVNKEGGISGPKVLEHMVDAVLYFEGDRTQSFRIVRSMKNRFGSTNEIGVFDMTDKGLKEIPNPSELMISEHQSGTSGTCASCVIEGSRPLITEIQSLVTHSIYPSPKRTSIGYDYNRMALITAVLEKRMGARFAEQDIYLNVVGGLRPNDTAVDLCVALSLLSGLTDKVIPDQLIAMGEIGLGGEIRPISNIEYRVKECIRLGFKTILIPKRNAQLNFAVPKDVSIVGIKNLFETLVFLKKKEERKEEL